MFEKYEIRGRACSPKSTLPLRLSQGVLRISRDFWEKELGSPKRLNLYWDYAERQVAIQPTGGEGEENEGLLIIHSDRKHPERGSVFIHWKNFLLQRGITLIGMVNVRPTRAIDKPDWWLFPVGEWRGESGTD